MAVKLITTIHRYSGLEEDTKPTAGVAVGSTFFETDSGANNQYDGSDWFQIFPQIDGSISGALVDIDIVHHEVHEGEHYTATFAEAIGSGSASVLLFETPGSATATIHFMAVVDTSAAGTLIFTAIPNATVGTAVYAQNNNQVIGGSSELSITHTGAVTTTGTILENHAPGDGGAGNKIGGESGLRNEWLLNHSARYLLQFTCSAASNVAWNALWYEKG